jgi:lysophospholipase L1-like esterase
MAAFDPIAIGFETTVVIDPGTKKETMPRIKGHRRSFIYVLPALLMALSILHCTSKRQSKNLNASVPPKIVLSEALLQSDSYRIEPAIAAFEQMERDSPSAKGGIIFTGSSSIRLWETLHEDMAPLEVVNRGFGGSIIRQVSFYADRILLPLEPKLIVLYCGENDICNDVYSHEEPLENFKDFVAIIHHSLPQTRILFLNMKPSPLRWEYWPKFQQGNRLIEEYSEKQPLLDYLDISTTMMAADGRTKPEIWKSDSLHMNAIGYEGWTQTVQPVVARIWKEISETPVPNGRRPPSEQRKP